MKIAEIKTNLKYLVIDSENNTCHVLKTDRNVSDLLKNTYEIILSHMYINRNLNNKDDYILIDDILIKKIW